MRTTQRYDPEYVATAVERRDTLTGGYIGIEFASMFAQNGSRVTVLDRNVDGDGATVHYSQDAVDASVEADAVLLALGRRPATASRLPAPACTRSEMSAAGRNSPPSR